MQISGLKVVSFGVFSQLEAKFARGVNVFIGENATGKSQLLKLLYALHTEAEQGSLKTLPIKLERVFRPDSLGRLVHRSVGRNSAKVELTMTDGAKIGFSLSTLGNVRPTEVPAGFEKAGRCIFLPTRDLLAIYEGFVALYEARELKGFDDTHYDTCKALSLPALRGPRLEAARKLMQTLEEPLGGSVAESGSRFYVNRTEGGVQVDLEAPLVSEGLRKVATIVRLVTNGTLTNKSVLFWDDPEANMNPRLVRDLVKFLGSIAQQGVQVFVATHDTLLCQRLASSDSVPVRFFALHRADAESDVELESSDDLVEIEHNPIFEEFRQFRVEQLENLK